MIFLMAKILMISSIGTAFTLNSQTDPNLKGFNSKSLSFQLNPANCPASIDLNGIIEAALKVWNNVPTANLEVKLGGSTTSTTYANPPSIYCDTAFGTTTGADVNGVPGAASVTTSGGRIVGGVLILNVQPGAQANIANYNPTSLKIILAHEIGHVLGLGHSEYVPALMYYDAGAKAHLTLGQDDMDGITYLYPRDELGGDGLLGCGRMGASNFNGPSMGLLLLMLMMPVLVVLVLRKHARL